MIPMYIGYCSGTMINLTILFFLFACFDGMSMGLINVDYSIVSLGSNGGVHRMLLVAHPFKCMYK